MSEYFGQINIRLNAVLRRNTDNPDVPLNLEDHMEEVVVLDVLDPPCVYTFICVGVIEGRVRSDFF